MLAVGKRISSQMSLPDRFEAQIAREPNSGCWLWAGSYHRQGYGLIRVHGKQRLAHRFSYERFIGEIPAGANICHKCDVPECVNPEHLFVGSQADNVADMVHKGRLADRRGSNHPQAKLSEQQVLAIRENAASQRIIAGQYGISKTMVRLIKQRKTWSHVP